jgi:hypothetical protein
VLIGEAGSQRPPDCRAILVIQDIRGRAELIRLALLSFDFFHLSPAILFESHAKTHQEAVDIQNILMDFALFKLIGSDHYFPQSGHTADNNT